MPIGKTSLLGLDALVWGTDSLALLCSLATLSQTAPEEYNQMLRAAATTHLRLDKFAAGDTAQLVGRMSGGDQRARAGPGADSRKGGRQPAVYRRVGIRAARRRAIAGRRGPVPAGDAFPDWSRLGLPDTLHGVITSRFDRLGTQQLAVKVASVIGHHFHFRGLHDNYPLESEKSHLQEHLAVAEQAEIIGLESPGPRTLIFSAT